MSSSNLTLQNLVEAIMNSISDAQDQIERQTLDNINEWFDDEGRPKTVIFKVPSLHPDDVESRKNGGELVEREIEVPLLTLMQKNPIKIKKLTSKFDISLGGVEIQENQGDTSKTLIGSETTKRIRKILSTDLFTGSAKESSKPRQASMEIEFESSEPTEAFLKIQNDLLRLF
ncbi:hypothetical protein AHAT_40570 [Agarivorans sp. Toyoura001]|uniref:DUF2589 domain-containing protein n=1 Tax=Agarivorans sp. Toyoura001 TaxID=2283141 RepID=UPI0010E63E5D|nr:DUF2589 domain-containing protein [Agarivorans sp. Toyoura001]GDY28167.1 hypothetical protein AHAT_40570 [Agarivorans sp. Toyoura001]